MGGETKPQPKQSANIEDMSIEQLERLEPMAEQLGGGANFKAILERKRRAKKLMDTRLTMLRRRGAGGMGEQEAAAPDTGQQSQVQQQPQTPLLGG